jgi:hypothetical protein
LRGREAKNQFSVFSDQFSALIVGYLPFVSPERRSELVLKAESWKLLLMD